MDVPLLANAGELHQLLRQFRGLSRSIGLVPTMGALHAGHAALIRRAAQENDEVVVSIFVNPTQFGPHEDFLHYPRTLAEDQQLVASAGGTLIFAPSVDTLYRPDASTSVLESVVSRGLCGPKRPGHFQGVCTVVSMLFNIIPADRAYFGEKDAQQLRVIKRMVRDLHYSIEIVAVPTVRDTDGLALSSRNRYLSLEERHEAPKIYQALRKLATRIHEGERQTALLQQHLELELRALRGATLDYAEIVDAESLQPVEKIHGPVLVAVALFLGKTRLIDNITIDPSAPSL